METNVTQYKSNGLVADENHPAIRKTADPLTLVVMQIAKDLMTPHLEALELRLSLQNARIEALIESASVVQGEGILLDIQRLSEDVDSLRSDLDDVVSECEDKVDSDDMTNLEARIEDLEGNSSDPVQAVRDALKAALEAIS